MTDLAAAFLLLTRIPVPWDRISTEPPDHARSVWAAPVVGWVVGAVGGAAVLAGTGLGLPEIAVAFLAVASQVLATGAFHEDGLADVADGFGGSPQREKKLEIMKDSRIGTYGGLALIVSVGLRVSAIADLAPTVAALGLIAAGAASRVSICALLAALPSARPEGLGSLLRAPSPKETLAALTLGGAPALLGLGVVTGAIALGAAAAGGALVALAAKRQVGGYTGDVLGAAQQLAEIAFLLALAAVQP